MWFGIGLSIVILVALLILSAPWWLTAVLLFVPVYIGAIGFLQVRNRFCVAYGGSGKQNASDDSDAATAVTDTEAIAADKAKTRKMNMQALGISIAVVAIAAIIAQIV